ncbi:olfactory receptor 10V1-like [Pelobates fuscus]|uniref:olfactory receptor 10V1-like n=1 Tax=Pelobates fuscus TaxID=191477 RepID=UPI002FE431D3
MYFFISFLSVLDICYTSTVVPQTLVNLMNTRHSISFPRCIAQMFCIVAFGAAQIILITVMAYDRYVAINNPLRYKAVMSWAICKMFLAITLIVSCAMALLMVLSVFTLPFCDELEIDHFFCEVGQVLRLTCPSTQVHELVEIVIFAIVLGFFSTNFLLVITSYVYIISAILKISTSVGRHKAFSTCSSHINVVTIEYACLGFLYLRPKTAYSIDKDRVFVVIFTFGTPILNPLIYSVRNAAVKTGFKKLIESKINYHMTS